MPFSKRLTLTLITILLVGCLRLLPATSGARTELIRDPSLNNMPANEFNVPSKWYFQGILFQGAGSCAPAPYTVFRATSPDGLSFVENIPVLGWIWATGPAANIKHEGCLPLKQAVSAQDFLKYTSAILSVEYMADEPVPADIEAEAQRSNAAAQTQYAPKYSANRMTPPKKTRELARATVRYRNGSFVMKGRLSTTVDCTEQQLQYAAMGGMRTLTSSQCAASVRFISAPEDKYQATVSMLDSINIGPTMVPAWKDAWINRNNQQAAMAINKIQHDGEVARNVSAQEFAHGQAVRQNMHEQFLSTMQRGTTMSMNRAAEIANSNHRMASDVVDYALDQQTVMDPGTGQISKVSSSYSYTWLDSTGKISYQTNNVNANPNYSFKGDWVRQQVTHGDGSAK